MTQTSDLLQQRSLLILLLAASAFLFLYQLTATHLTNWDEAWHAAIARNMAQTNDFVTPVYNGNIWFATAPFYLWLTAIWFKLTNFSLTGVRLFSAISGLGSVILTYSIGFKLFNKRTGLIAAFILTTTIQFLFRARQGNLDVPLAFFNTLAIFSFIKGRQDHRWFLGIGASTALGFLTKSVLGLFPLFLLFFVPKKAAIKSVLIFFAITTPWHLLATLKHGQSFVNQYFLQYAFSKATNANPVSGTQAFWYFGVLKHGLKTWTLVLPFAFFWATLSIMPKQIKAKLPVNFKLFFLSTKKQQKNLSIPLLWFILPFLALTIARMRNDWYLISLYPAAALLIALFLDYLLLNSSKVKNSQLLHLTIAFLIFAAGIFNVTKYNSSFIVPETVAAEVKLATKAKQISRPNESIMLDDNYLPVASFYTNRHITTLRFSRAYDSLVSQSSLKTATASGSRLVLTNSQTLKQLINAFGNPDYQLIESADDKFLIRLQFNHH